MSEKMLVTQALDERDLLVKKINDKIDKASFVDTIKPNEEKVFNSLAKGRSKTQTSIECTVSCSTIDNRIRSINNKLKRIER
mgnify:CR=1 FL=1